MAGLFRCTRCSAQHIDDGAPDLLGTRHLRFIVHDVARTQAAIQRIAHRVFHLVGEIAPVQPGSDVTALCFLRDGGLAAAIGAFEAISERLGRVMSYVDLIHAGNMSDTAIGCFVQTTREQVTDISTEILFFTLELNRIDDDVLERKMADPEAAPYAPWVRDTRVFRNHQLSDDLEKLLHEKIVTGRNAWIRLFNETMSDMCFEVDGKENTLDEILNLLNATKGETRKSAGYALGRGLINNIRTLTLITNTLAKDKEIEDQWRGYPNPVSYRNLANHVEDEVITALVGSVRHSFGELSHRYYRLKARWFGVNQLGWRKDLPRGSRGGTPQRVLRLGHAMGGPRPRGAQGGTPQGALHCRLAPLHHRPAVTERWTLFSSH